MNKNLSYHDYVNQQLNFKIRINSLKKLKKLQNYNSNTNIYNSKNFSTINTSIDFKKADKSNNMNNMILSSIFDNNNVNCIKSIYLNPNIYEKKNLKRFHQDLTPINRKSKTIDYLKTKKSLSSLISPISKKEFSDTNAKSDLVNIDINKNNITKKGINTQLNINDSKKKFNKKSFTKMKSSTKLINNSPLNVIKNYNLFCKKNNKPILEAIKYHLTLYWDNKFGIISDFFKKNRMSKLINVENINNFADYIINNFHKIDFDIPMNNIILNGVKYNYKIITKNKIIDCKINKDNSNQNDISKNNDIINEKEDNNKIQFKYSINNLKQYLNRKYKDINKTQDLTYFHHQTGKIDTYEDSNLCINLSKQKKFYEKEKLEHSDNQFNKNSIELYNEKDLNKLNDELNKIKDIKINIKSNKIHSRLYYEIMKQYYNDNSDYLPRKKHKLLEYIIFKNIKSKYNLYHAIENLEKKQKEKLNTKTIDFLL